MTVIGRRTRSFNHGEPERLDLRKANLSGANLSGANLSLAEHLTQEQLEETTGDENTRLPLDLEPPAHWNMTTDEQTNRN
jgi:hypothetical protein